MAEEGGQEKTEEPTPKRQEESRDKGQVARSRELNTFGMMLISSLGIIFVGTSILNTIMNVMKHNFSFKKEDIMSLEFGERLYVSFMHVTPSLVALFIIFIVAALIIPGMIGGWTLSLKALMPDPKRLDPIAGVKRIFSIKGVMELVKSLGKFVVIASTGLMLVYFNFAKISDLTRMSVHVAIPAGLAIFAFCFVMLSLSLALIAMIDIPFQLWDHNRQLKMTKQELKDEHKETEGNPQVKAKVRQLQRQQSQRRMMDELPSADVVITNPTHFAVAIKYDHDNYSAPRIIAKGADLVAKNICKIANAHNIPIISAPPLARAIFFSTELGEEIPYGLYTAVAQVLALVFRLKKKIGTKSHSFGPLNDLPIPDEYKH